MSTQNGSPSGPVPGSRPVPGPEVHPQPEAPPQALRSGAPGPARTDRGDALAGIDGLVHLLRLGLAAGRDRLSLYRELVETYDAGDPIETEQIHEVLRDLIVVESIPGIDTLEYQAWTRAGADHLGAVALTLEAWPPA